MTEPAVLSALRKPARGTMRATSLVTTSTLLASCAFTVPTGPTVSYFEKVTENGVEKWKYHPSPASSQMAQTALTWSDKSFVFDEAKRCENRLSALIAKMKRERGSRAALVVIGGTATLAGSFIAAVQKGNPDDKTGQISAASVAAVGGLVALTTTLVGEPAAELDRYNTAASHYEAARRLADSYSRGVAPCATDDCFREIRQQLSLCSGDPPPPVPTGK